MTGVKIELFKLLKMKSTKVFFSIYAFVLVGLCLLYLTVENGYGLDLYYNSGFVSASLRVMMGFLLPLLAVFLAATVQGLDYSRGTIKNMFLLPQPRTNILKDKLVAGYILVGGALLGQFFITLGISVFQDGITVGGGVRAFLDYGGAFLVLNLIYMYATLIIMLVKSTGLTLLITYLSYLLFGILGHYLPIIKTISLPTLISSYGQLLFDGQIIKLLSIVAYYIIFLVAGLGLFEKKEEHLCQFE